MKFAQILKHLTINLICFPSGYCLQWRTQWVVQVGPGLPTDLAQKQFTGSFFSNLAHPTSTSTGLSSSYPTPDTSALCTALVSPRPQLLRSPHDLPPPAARIWPPVSLNLRSSSAGGGAAVHRQVVSARPHRFGGLRPGRTPTAQWRLAPAQRRGRDLSVSGSATSAPPRLTPSPARQAQPRPAQGHTG